MKIQIDPKQDKSDLNVDVQNDGKENCDQPRKTITAERQGEGEKLMISPEQFHKRLREEGCKKLIEFGDVKNEAQRKPHWLDEEKFRSARQIMRKYKVGIEFSSLTGLFLILQIPDGLEPLLVTGNSKDIPSLFNRYLNTILYVRSWYDDDVFDPETKGYKSIRLVRGMHKGIQKRMNETLTIPDVNGKQKLWFTQYDVSQTQFSFIGMAMLYPAKCGLIAASRHELEMINYYWRVLGFMMGVEDEFNCCYFDNLEDIRTMMRLMLEHEFKPRLTNEPCPTGTAMCQAICLALSDFVIMITFNSLAHWWSDIFQFNGYELKPMTAKEKLLTRINNLSFNTLFKYKSLLELATKLHIYRFDARLKIRDKIYKGLVSKYGDAREHSFKTDRVYTVNSEMTTANKANPLTLTQGDGKQELANTALGCPMSLAI